MGAITYKANKINTYVKPEIAKSASNIYEAMLTANEIKCPSDFSYCQYVNNLYNNLGNLKKHVQGINSWLLESNSKIKKFENTKKTQIKNIKKSQIDHKKFSNNKMKIQSFSVKKADKDVSNREINDGFKSIYDLNVKNANMVGAAVIAETNDTNNFEKISLNPTENVKKTGAKQAENTDSALDWGIEQAESIGAKIVDVAESFWGWLKGAASKVLDFIERCAATVLTAIQSILKGLLEFVEAILDFAVILGSGIASVGTGIADGVSYLVTGETLGATKGMWKWTKSYVSYEVVDELSDILYKDTAYGKWLSEKSFISPDGTVANVLSGVGYVAGVVVLSILTFGTGGAAVSATSTGASAATGVSSTGMAAVAGAAGVGKGTSDAWNDGASVVKGLGYGAINGAIEGVQFYAGAKINGLTVTGGKTVAQKFVNSGVRIALDGADSAVEVPIYAGLKGIYNDKSFQQNWDNDGGWKAVGTAAAVGSIASSIGEADLSKKALSSINKTFKSTKGDMKSRMYKIMKYIDPESEFSMRGGYVDLSLNEKNVDDALEQARIDLNLKMEKYATYSDIKESDVYIQYMKNHEYKNDIFDNLESDMKQLEKGIKKDSKKIDNLLVKKSKQSIGSLKSEILDSMPNNLSKVEKARYIYINLSKKVKYDENYFVTQNEDIYKQVLDINNLKGNKVICKGWSELYKQLLLQAGFSEDEVKIVGRQKIGAHKLVEIKLNGYKVFADATNNYGGMIDLISTKVGAKTMGFVRAPLDLDLSDKGGSKLREFFTKRSSLDEKWVEEIDKTIYPDKKNIDDLSKKINENFGDSSIYSKLFGSNYNENIDSKIRVLNPLLEKLDGFETFGFLKKQKSNFFNSSENSNTHVTLLQKAKNGKEGKTLTCLSVKISDNKYKYYINKDGAGLIEVPVKTIHDLFQVGYDYWGDHQEFILGLWK